MKADRHACYCFDPDVSSPIFSCSSLCVSQKIVQKTVGRSREKDEQEDEEELLRKPELRKASVQLSKTL
jgi:hypothetical protein